MQVGNLVLQRSAYKHDHIRGGGGAVHTINNKGSDKWFGSRGFTIEGYSPPGSPNTTNVLQYTSIGVGGTSVDFGDGTHAAADGGNQCDGEASNGVRMVFSPGYRVGAANNSPVKQHFNALVHSNAIDFGDMLTASWPHGAATNGSRVMESAGDYTSQNTEIFNIGTPANAIQDNDQAQQGSSRCGSTDGSRGVFTGGRTGGGSFHDQMEYFQIQAAYSGADFDELGVSNYFFGTINSCSGRSLVVSGGSGPNNQMKCFNLQNNASSFDFGELSNIQSSPAGSCDGVRGQSSGAHGAAGDWGTPTANSIEYINVYTRGNSVDFAEMVPGIHTRDCRGGSAA